jgi:putative ABC transport system permease protein
MINVLETVRISLRALKANKTRSALTMLGIEIGVMAVIIMFAVGNGANMEIAERFASLGTNILMVRPGTERGPGSATRGTINTLVIDDAYAIAEYSSAVAYAAPVSSGNAQVVYGNSNYPARITGTTPDYFAVQDWELVSGRVFTDQDVRGATKVCVVGQTIVRELFSGQDPEGKVIRVKKVPMMVIGVLEELGESSRGDDQDNIIIIPVSTALRRIFSAPRPDSVSMISVKAVSENHLEIAQKQIEDLLAIRHRIRPGEENDFTVRNLTQFIESAKSATNVMTLLLIAVAGISLLVGGIGIMNIMLVSVTERTREIGIRMAIGAKRKDIQLQFLVEALILSLLGGITGIVLGIGGAWVISSGFGWTVLVSLESIILSFGFSAFVGVFFGYYPAWKASLLNPIDALRHE